MADILPFVATRYATTDGEKLSKLLTPPYDVIDEKMQQELYDSDPHNFVRVDFGKVQPGDDELQNRYARSEATWKEWKKEGILTEDDKKAFYVYEQEFELAGGQTFRRRGFFAAVRLQDFSEGGIRAHEHTFDGPKADRYRLMRATNSNMSPIFCLYEDAQKTVDGLIAKGVEGKTPIQADFGGVIHRLWVLEQSSLVDHIIAAMADKTLFIADGHHRYETSLLYRNKMREIMGKNDGNQPYDYTLMYLNNTCDDGLVVLPTHRILTKECSLGVDAAETIEDIEQYFDVKEIAIDHANLEAEALRVTQEMAQAGEAGPAFVMLLPKGKAYQLSLKADTDLAEMIDDENIPLAVKELDVTILHQYLINQAWLGNPEIELDDQDVIYVKDASVAIEKMKGCKYGVAFLLNPTKTAQVTAIAQLGLRMPHKSTYFYPKLCTGMVIRDMNSPW